MDLLRINQHLNAYGYSFTFKEDGTLLSETELNLPSSIDCKPFISMLSMKSHPLCELLLQSQTVVDILLSSLNQADYPIPPYLLDADEFELVGAKKDQKKLNGHVKNGLYAYLENYGREIPHEFKLIQRKDKSFAFIIEPIPGPNHLTIDEYYLYEQASGRFFYHYAHISMVKAGARVRVYFDETLKVVKTTAYHEEDGVKIAKIDIAHLDIQASDYQALFAILSDLRKLHREKIQELNIAFTPSFMFIKNAVTLENCRQQIAIINRLKSPYHDFREDFLAQDISNSASSLAHDSLSDDSESEINKELHSHAPVKGSVHEKLDRKQINRKTKKQQRKLVAVAAISAAFTDIEDLIASATHENLNVNKALDEILKLEFLMIHYSNEIEERSTAYESRIESHKLGCLDILHAAFLAGDFDFLTRSYEQGTSFIDSIIYRYLMQLVEKLNKGRQSVSASDKEKFKKLTDLLQFYYEKNELFEGFFYYLKRQLAYNHQSGTIYSFIMRMINVHDDPSFIQFLINKGFIAVSDCIGVLNFKYISLQQYILLTADELSRNYLTILDFLIAEKVNVLAVTKTALFEKLIKNPKEYCVGAYQFDGGRISRMISNQTSIESLNISCKDIRALTPIDFCQLHSYHTLSEPWQVVAQNFFVHHPILALNYLSILISSKLIHRRVLRSNQPQVHIFSNMMEMDLYTCSIAYDEQEKVSISYLFYPVDHASPNVKLQVLFAQQLLERIRLQPYMHEMRNDNGVMMSYMNELKKAENADQKLNLILSAVLYTIMMPWSINTFKKYFFFLLHYIETLVEISQGSLIKPHLHMINEMINAFANPTLRQTCHLQLLRSLEKINQTYEIEDELMGLFR